MNHDYLKDKLFFYKDPETPENERREIADHLKTCEECRRALALWEKASTALRQVRLEPSAAFTDRVMGRLEDLERAAAPVPEETKPSFLDWLLPALGYAFAAGLMVVAVSHREIPVSTEGLLLTSLPQKSQWALSVEGPDIGSLMEM